MRAIATVVFVSKTLDDNETLQEKKVKGKNGLVLAFYK
jgi:hypothetical protein